MTIYIYIYTLEWGSVVWYSSHYICVGDMYVSFANFCFCLQCAPFQITWRIHTHTSQFTSSKVIVMANVIDDGEVQQQHHHNPPHVIDETRIDDVETSLPVSVFTSINMNEVVCNRLARYAPLHMVSICLYITNANRVYWLLLKFNHLCVSIPLYR